MSKEYIGAVVILFGSVLKMFNIEIPNDAIEGLIFGIIAVIIAISRFQKKDIDVLGRKV